MARFLRVGGINERVKRIPIIVENAVVMSVGITISAGESEPKATRIPIMDVGISCMDVALMTKNIAVA